MHTRFFGAVSVLPALCVIVIALLSVLVLTKKKHFELQPVNYAAIDGLKGYLSLLVFICHGSVWFYYLRTGQWTVPPSNLYTHFGPTSVALFFMITAFLFCNKLTRGRTNWLKLYISRLLRLFPLYLIAMILLFIIVAYLSNFSVNESWFTIASELRIWLMFTLKNTPDINAVKDTWIITSSVVWSLRYEWFFYLSLPIISFIFFKDKPNLLVIIFSFSSIIFLLKYRDFVLINFASFIGGLIATLLSFSKKFTQLASRNLTSSIILVLSYIIFIFLPSDGIASLFLASVVFVLIASGNTIFGFLSSSLSRELGQLSYGIYLFHGIIYFIFFKFVLGFDKAANLSSLQHWICIFLITPILISISYVLHIYVELPALQFTPLLYKKINDGISTFKQKIVVGIKF